MVNIVKNPVDLCLVIFVDMEKKLFDPGYQVVLEGSFYNLMKQVRGKKFMYVGPWKLIRERLKSQISKLNCSA